MREIKFRAWDKKRKEYFHISEMWNGGTDPSCFSTDGWVDNYGSRGNMKDIVVEQYTGLKDKNGKEIYEGDILKRKDFIFYDGNFIFLPVEYKYAEWELGIRRLNDIYKSCEVVGNIHENADLLEVSK